MQTKSLYIGRESLTTIHFIGERTYAILITAFSYYHFLVCFL